jgi:hypothetical protein
MPRMIKMSLTNANEYAEIIKQTLMSKNKVAPPNAPSLSAPMIGRIHSVKPGCSSCGRH